MTDDEVDGAGTVWLDLREACGPSLVAVLLETVDGGPSWDQVVGRSRPLAEVDTGDVAATLRAMWDGNVPDPEEDEAESSALLEPYGREFPGLAPATKAAAGTAPAATALDAATPGATAPGATPPGATAPAPALAEVVEGNGRSRIGLVAARRPADVVATIGWLGSVNHHDSPSALAVVLRSWEDRFGAVLMRLRFDTIELAVSHPPQTLGEALPVAAEMWAVCATTVADSIRDLAEGLVGAPTWFLWWD